jgi:hypothetical protein
MVFLSISIAVWQQTAGAQVQGPENSAASDEELRERVKSLEETVEQLKRERGSSKAEESPEKSKEGTKDLITFERLGAVIDRET